MVIRSDYLLLILPNHFSIPGSRGWNGAEVGHPGPCSEALLPDEFWPVFVSWAGSCWIMGRCVLKRI